MLTALLLLPVLVILVWLYWFMLPGRKWLLTDSTILLLLLLSMVAFVSFVDSLEFDSAGPLWPYIVSTAGAYGILLLGLGLALGWRYYRAKNLEASGQ